MNWKSKRTKDKPRHFFPVLLDMGKHWNRKRMGWIARKNGHDLELITQRPFWMASRYVEAERLTEDLYEKKVTWVIRMEVCFTEDPFFIVIPDSVNFRWIHIEWDSKEI